MKPNDIRNFLDGRVKIKVNSISPSGQGFSPRIIDETHFNISLNSHNINITESAFNEMLRVFESQEDIIRQKEIIATPILNLSEIDYAIKDVKEEKINAYLDAEILNNLRTRYVVKFAKQLPPRYKNDIKWIEKALAE
jgi:hypothetical protein